VLCTFHDYLQNYQTILSKVKSLFTHIHDTAHTRCRRDRVMVTYYANVDFLRLYFIFVDYD